MDLPSDTHGSWSSRWPRLARAAGIERDERLLLALSGGADSVLLLHLLAESDPRPILRAVHVEHGLRGEDGRADARFCVDLCRSLGVPIAVRSLELDPAGPSLEGRARAARYAVLVEEARASGHRTILTGHHSDDALETLLWRWIRGSPLEGLRGPRRELELDPVDPRGDPAGVGGPVRLVRPLLPLRREEVRRLLADRGLAWREDRSNQDERFTRNRLRNAFLPFLETVGGEQGIENLRAFGRAVEGLEHRLAAETAHLAWRAAPYAALSRGPDEIGLGGVLERSALMSLSLVLQRRALWRLLFEGTGEPCGRATLEAVLEDLRRGRARRHSLPGGWTLLLRPDELHLLPPRDGGRLDLARERESCLPFPLGSADALGPAASVTPDAPLARSLSELLPFQGLTLRIPGQVALPDGRRLAAERVGPSRSSALSSSSLAAELDAERLPESMHVRWPRAGDRFHALGAPGSKPISRFLADRKIPREERGSIPVVVAGDEILWVAGIEPAERHRVRPETRARVRLSLHPGSPPGTAFRASSRRNDRSPLLAADLVRGDSAAESARGDFAADPG
jgi:tRNA(Ile)-lysidine synthase